MNFFCAFETSVNRVKGCEVYLLYTRVRININVWLVALHRRGFKNLLSGMF